MRDGDDGTLVPTDRFLECVRRRDVEVVDHQQDRLALLRGQLTEVIRELVPGAGPLEFAPLPKDDPRQRKPDITVAKKVLGWQPQVPLRTGILKTIDYFRSRM